MKKLQMIIALLLCAVLLCACDGDSQPDTTTTAPSQTTSANLMYSIQVVDPMGAPCNWGIIVSFQSGTEVVAMQNVNEQGVAEKLLPRGNYTVQLGFTDASASYHFDTSDIVLTPEQISAQVVLANKAVVDEWTHTTYDPDTGVESSYTEYLYHAGTGFTYIPLTTQERTYVYFTPTQAGLYQFSLVNSDAVLGYYGSPYFVQDMNLAEVDENGAFTINVSKGMIGTSGTGTSVFVLGIDGGELADCIIRIERIADAELTIEDYPWDIYQATVDLGAFAMSENVKLHDFDLTADSYTLVLNEFDGFYHLNTEDGPLVYAKLGASSEYLDSIQTVLESSGIARYFYDEDGNFVKKVSYSECLLEYIACMDENTGLYPLTEDLAHIFQQRGEYVGWWDSESDSYLFVDQNGNPVPGINPDIAWLFLCCYGEVTTDPGPSDPDVTEPTEPSTKPTEPSEKPTEPPHTHDYVKTVVKSTCLEQGYTRYSCACGESYDSDFTKATGHSWGEWSVTKEATETATGEQKRVCANCDASEAAQIPMVIPEHTHDYTGAVTKEATCKEEGVKTYTCSCGASYTESIAKTDHSYNAKVTAPTCTDRGYTTYTCSACGDSYKADEKAATGHTWGDWEVTTEYTEEDPGIETRVCSACGIEETGTIMFYFHVDETMSFDATVKAGQFAYYKLYRMFDMILTIESDDVYLIFDDQIIEPVDGVLNFTLVYGSNDVSSPCEIAIGNLEANDAVFTVKLASIPGTQNNPVNLELGTFVTTTRDGDYQGFYYIYTADAAGVLTLRFDSIDINMECEISLYNINTKKFEVATNSSVSVNMNAGDIVQIHFAVLDPEYQYPAAKITATATLE